MHPVLARLDKSIAVLERRLARLEGLPATAERSRRRDVLVVQLRDLRRKRKATAGGLERVRRRRDPARDARITQDYAAAKGSRGAVKALAVREGLTTEQIRRIAAQGHAPADLQEVQAELFDAASTDADQADVVVPRANVAFELGEHLDRLRTIQRGLRSASRGEASTDLFGGRDWASGLGDRLAAAIRDLRRSLGS